MFPATTPELPAPDTFEPPDTAFRIGIGVYVAAVLTGAALIVGVALDASGGLFVATVPTTVSVGLVAGSALGARAEGVAERTGRSRRLTAAWFLPAVAFAGVALAALSLPSPPVGFAVAGGLATGAALFGAVVVATMARTRYVAAITPDDPVATWRWRSPTRARNLYAIGAAFFAFGLWTATRENPVLAVQWFLFGLFFLAQGLEASGRLDGLDLGLDDSRAVSELRVHEAGLVVARPYGTGLVTWEDVEDVALTGDELAIERRGWLDVRCDRAVIDDPGAVAAEIRRARGEATVAE